MKQIFSLVILLSLFISCGSFNKADGELHYYNNISYGQQMLDLQDALKKNAITQSEYDELKQRIMDDDLQIPEFMDNDDEENY